MLNVDGWTDGRTNERTNGRKLARLCLPAKAGATKKVKVSHSLLAVGAVGVRVPLYLGHSC